MDDEESHKWQHERLIACRECGAEAGEPCTNQIVYDKAIVPLDLRGKTKPKKMSSHHLVRRQDAAN